MDLLAAVRETALSADHVSRQAITTQLYSLARELETSYETMQRLLYQPIMLPVLRTACDLDLFKYIVDCEQPTISCAELAEKSGASSLLLSRLLRYLASVDVVCEVAPDTYTASNTTRTLAQPGWKSAIYVNFNVVWSGMAAIPDFFKENGYTDAQDEAYVPFNKGKNTKQRVYDWYLEQGDLFEHFNRFMSIQRQGLPTWLDKYPFLDVSRGLGEEEEEEQKQEQAALFVDIGGGRGHQSVALRRALPENIKGRIIVQDQPGVVKQAMQQGGVEQMAHDFFTAQPVHGARMYYLRNIMHNWPEEKALTILRHTRDAMGVSSVLLIDEMVLPDRGAHLHAAQLDILMMVMLAARERTLQQWEALVRRAGLRIRHVYRYMETLGDSIIECVRV